MKFIVADKWDKTFQCDGLLFFVQRLEEMLYHYSEDIFRVPVHNTSTLIFEYLKLEQSIKAGVIKEYQEAFVFQELKNMITSDAILIEKLGKDFLLRIEKNMNINCKNRQEHASLVKYLRASVPVDSYTEWCQEFLRKHVRDEKHKEEIEYGLRVWIPQLIWKGYTADYIYSFTLKYFSDHIIKSYEEFDEYLAHFDFEKKKFNVYFQISNSLFEYKDMLEKRLNLVFQDDGNFKLIKQYKKHSICFLEIEALDPYCAMKSAYKKFDTFIRFYRFLGNKKHHIINKFGLVLQSENSNSWFLPVDIRRFHSPEINDSSYIKMGADSLIIGLQENVPKLFSTLNKAINLHNSALRSYDINDGFLNMWSILEILCPARDGTPKIEPIQKNIIPILQNDYFAGHIADIAICLKENLIESDWSKLIDSIQENSTDENIKVACFVFLPKYEELREEYFKLLSKFPVIRQKIWRLYNLREDKAALFKMSKKYAQRITWHIYRLYRNRNSIIHSGDAHYMTIMLGEHLHTYIDRVLNEVMVKLASTKRLRSIDSVFIDTRLLVEEKEEYFSKNEAVSYDCIKEIFKQYFC